MCVFLKEIGAALVDFRNYAILSKFHEYVRPTLHPQLSHHCTKLTGITQSFIDGQDPFTIAYRKFINWLETIAKENDFVFITTKSNKDDFSCHVPNNHTTFFVWGRWNLNDLFRVECQRNSINPPEYLKHWIDARKHIAVSFILKINRLDNSEIQCYLFI